MSKTRSYKLDFRVSDVEPREGHAPVGVHDWGLEQGLFELPGRAWLVWRCILVLVLECL